MFGKKMNSAAFDNFDPDGFDNQEVVSDLYDPDFATGVAPAQAPVNIQTARPGRKLQLNISIANNTARQLNTELFSALDSVTTRQKPEYISGNYEFIPALSLEGLAALIATPTGGKVVGFNKLGNLEVRGGVGDPVLTVGCGEYPYNSLFESTKVYPFYVSYVRYTVSTDAQIDNTIYNFTRTFGGGVKENSISPRAYFKPNQFQNKTIDILAPFNIDAESGLRIPTNAGEYLRLAFFIQRWGRNSL